MTWVAAQDRARKREQMKLNDIQAYLTANQLGRLVAL
jgi:hypothetical protein